MGTAQSTPTAIANEPFPMNLDHIKARIEQLRHADTNLYQHPDWEFIVLVSTGALCPPHRCHMVSLVKAADHINKRLPYKLFVGGLVMPTHAQYVDSKLRRRNKTTSIDGADRLAMTELALREQLATAGAQDLAGSTFEASSWELDQPAFVDYPQTVNAVRNQLLRALAPIDDAFLKANLHRVKIWYLCGADHALGCGLLNAAALQGWADGIVITGRTSADTPASLGLEVAPNVVFVPSVLYTDVSSTEIRRLMMSGEMGLITSDMLHPSVKNYIIKNKIVIRHIDAPAATTSEATPTKAAGTMGCENDMAVDAAAI